MTLRIMLLLILLGSSARAQSVQRFEGDSAVMLQSGETLHVGESSGAWTLMAMLPEYAVLEDVASPRGHLLFVGRDGARLDLPKSLESTARGTAPLYSGHSADQVRASASDLLGAAILAQPGDPDYDAVAQVFPPITHVKYDTHDFVGTPDTSQKVGFSYGGHTPNFDPAVLQPSIEPVRAQWRVERGLVGGWLPVLRYVYPEPDGAFTEMLAFAPFRTVNGNRRVQPVWYRVSRVEGGKLAWSKCVDSYLPTPPRAADSCKAFYGDLLRLEQRWRELLAAAVQLELPDARSADLARFSLVRAIMTRVGVAPKYGVVDREYGGSEHDGFQDTFTVETSAMIAWGLGERAGQYIDNYFGRFVRDDGSLLYRGPEIGQYGRMLTVVAEYANDFQDNALLLRWRKRIDAVAKLLLSLRAQARERAPKDPAFGMIAGFCEADSCLEREPARYLLPYFSNSTEAVRGLGALGQVWRALGLARGDQELRTWGERLIDEAEGLRKDLARAVERSQLLVGGKRMLPAIAGASVPFDVAVKRDANDPQFRAYRAYSEMLYSGVLTREQDALIVDYRTGHHDILLGVPTAYGYASNELAGFLAYGHGYGLIHRDRIREALLLFYSHIAHGYTRGAWLAPETRRPFSEAPDAAAPYCTPAQLTAALMLRWLLAFEDPEAEVLWLGKGIPRAWLKDGQHVRASAIPTRWGRVSFTLDSHVATHTVAANVELPAASLGAEIRLRMRVPEGLRMRSVRLNGQPWKQFDAASETVIIPARPAGTVAIEVQY